MTHRFRSIPGNSPGAGIKSALLVFSGEQKYPIGEIVASPFPLQRGETRWNRATEARIEWGDGRGGGCVRASRSSSRVAWVCGEGGESREKIQRCAGDETRGRCD